VQALVLSRASTGRAAGCGLNERAQRTVLLCFAEPTALSKIRPDLPTYLFSGSEDLLEQLESARTPIDRDRTAGVRNVSQDFYEGGRHEVLNELNREEVRTNLLIWLCTILRGQSHHSEALWAQ